MRAQVEQSGKANVKTAVAILRRLFGERLSTTTAVCRQHADVLGWQPIEPPDGVVAVSSTQDVVDVMQVCGAHGVPIIAYGAGSSFEGHLNAPFGGICLDMSAMRQILAVNADDLDVVVEAGVTRKQINAHLRDTGLFFPIDPGEENASLGGMAATRASGTTAVRYGTMRDNVVNLTAVLADGSVVRTAKRARKSSAGYDLTRLLVGSEGTLGIITELTVRVYGIPESIIAGVCPFPDVEAACRAVSLAIQSGLIAIARIELLDAIQIGACNAYSKLDLAETPTLFLEFHGTPTATREQVELFAEIAADHGALGFERATRHEDRNRLWRARHDALWASKALRPGALTFVTDVCVPISNLAEAVTQTCADAERTGLIAPLVGHVGDGNFHLMVLVDPQSSEEVERVARFLDRLVSRAHDLDGTCTGEHGVGTVKRKYLRAEYGAGLDMMRAIKTALDPQNILNPGKILPSE